MGMELLIVTIQSAIEKIDLNSSALSSVNQAIQGELLGHDLRALSMRLETFGSEQQSASFLGQNLRSLNLLIKQFRILYASTVKFAPLRARTYTLILAVLISPVYINDFSLKQALIFAPPLLLAITLSSMLITKVAAGNTKNASRLASVLTLFTGFLPFISNQIGQQITRNPNTAYPFYVSAISLPLGYYAFMKVLQILQPQAIALITKNDLKATNALDLAIKKIVSDEFAHTLSHRWAIYIHGKILTRLAATSLKQEMATNSNDSKTFKETVDSLLQILKSPDSDFDRDAVDLDSEIASRLDPWLGLLEVDLFVEPKLKEMKNLRVKELGEAIEEIVSNSIRHGKAQKLSLRVISKGDHDVEIAVIDDSKIAPPDYQTRYGLGTRIFNLVSDGRWSITRVDSSTVFNLVMAIE